MFAGLAQVWTPVAIASQLRGARPLGVTVAGERLVLFRDGRGQVAALADRCPHRGVSLSLGTVREGCLRCPFHGWSFDGAGRNTHVPWHPSAKRERLGTQAYPVRERGGLVWVFTGLDPAGSEPSLPSEVERPDVRLSGEVVTWRAHWTRVVENMLDDAHLPFVHPRSIGRGMLERPEATLETTLREEPWGLAWRVSIDGRAQDYDAELRWPNTMLLRIPVPGRLLAIHFTAVPVDATYTRIIQLGVRGFLRPRAFDPLFRWINRRVLREDQRVVESTQGPVPDPSAERSVPSDVVSLRFRQHYLQTLGAPRGRRGGAA